MHEKLILLQSLSISLIDFGMKKQLYLFYFFIFLHNHRMEHEALCGSLLIGPEGLWAKELENIKASKMSSAVSLALSRGSLIT